MTKTAIREKTGKIDVRTVSVDALTLDPSNVRKHSARNLEAIKASLLKFGQQHPIIATADGVVVAGNGRLQAMRAMGWPECAVAYTGLQGAEATAFAIADNRTAELAEWDDDGLAQTLAALQNDESIDHLVAGFTDAEISDLIGGDDPEVVEDEVPEPPADPVTKPGDVWVLGRHRLVCGDSTDAGVWDALGIKDGDGCLCFASPPYNLGKSVALSGNMNKSENAYDEYDDSQTADDWASLCDRSLDCAMANCGAAVFNLQPLASNKRALMSWMSSRTEWRDTVVWDKGHAAPAMAPGVLASRYEFLIVFGPPQETRRVPLSSWRGTQQSVYQGPGQRNNEYSKIHAATFPVHLPAYVMTELCNKATSVVDCFCGTGTTIIAAEQSGRIGYGIEISPAYCDVIVQRWEALTGEKATLESA